MAAAPERGVPGVDDELVDEVFEGGAEVVRELADDHAEADRWLPELLDPVDVLRGIRLELADEFDRIAFEEGGGLLVEYVQVLFRAREFREGSGQ